HFCDHTEMEDHAAHQLHVEMALAQNTFRGFPHRGEGVGQNIVEGLAVGEALAERDGARRKLGVAEFLDLGLETVDLVDRPGQALDIPVVSGTKHPPGEPADHRNLKGVIWKTGCAMLTATPPRPEASSREIRGGIPPVN